MSKVKKILKKAAALPGLNKMVPYYHLGWSLAGAIKHQNPSHDMRVIGITGTKGKSSVAFILSDILGFLGYKVASISSIGTKINGKERPNNFKMTMPGKGYIQDFLSEARKEGCQYAIIEVTSQGILQNRHRFINFDAGIFTNLQREHIEAHGSMENYRAEKVKFFKELSASARKKDKESGQNIKKRFVINIDDKNFEYFSRFTVEEKIGYSLKKENVEKLDFTKIYIPKEVSYKDGISFVLEGQKFTSKLRGEFNIYNILAAVSFCLAEGLEAKKISEAISKTEEITGRMEFIKAGQKFDVIVDYAHTPDSLKALYEAAKDITKDNGRLVCLLGAAGGGRDKWKRPEMAAIAEKYCDVVCLSNEDPYEEDPGSILDEMEKGMTEEFKKDKQRFFRILDRTEAIEKMISLAKEKDTVVFSGKGSEKFIMEKENKVPWNEKETITRAIEKK
jgi:UDP-N-acetylmuramyl-tripeptide synthetase